MWTFLIDLLFHVLTKPNKRTPAIYVVVLTLVVIGYAVVTIVSKSDFSR
jgi:hypothetical protein